MCHTLYVFAQTSLLAKVHCNELLVWFEASGFCYTTNLDAHQDSSRISCGCPELWRSRGYGPTELAPSQLQELIDWVTVGLEQLQVLNLGLDGT